MFQHRCKFKQLVTILEAGLYTNTAGKYRLWFKIRKTSCWKEYTAPVVRDNNPLPLIPKSTQLYSDIMALNWNT